jgi:hypothetical protein
MGRSLFVESWRNRDLSPGEILLIKNALVCGDKQFKLTLRCIEQIAVADPAPAALLRSAA